MHEKKREIFPLKTANRQEAAMQARQIYQHILMRGFEDALTTFKGVSKQQESNQIQTLGDFLAALKTQTDIPIKRLIGYAQDLRSIVADIAGIPRGGRGGNRQKALEWRTEVEKVHLDKLTPAVIAGWKKRFLESYPDDPVSRRRAKITVNSTLRCAKSLFSKKYLQQITTTVAISNPFEGITMEKRQSQRYRSSFNIYELIKAAKEELREQEPELFKIFLLAAMSGLRRKEIDCLLWEQVRFEDEAIRIEPTKWFQPKSEDSIGDIEVDAELLAVLKEMQDGSSTFVVHCSVEPNLDAAFDTYRCAYLFKKLIRWLQAKGVKGTKPIHELRKEFGSLLADAHGIYVASRMLRHADISVTASHYLEQKSRKTVGLGEHL